MYPEINGFKYEYRLGKNCESFGCCALNIKIISDAPAHIVIVCGGETITAMLGTFINQLQSVIIGEKGGGDGKDTEAVIVSNKME